MKFIFIRILFFLSIFLNAQEEGIDLFHADIEIDSSSVITVTEHINIISNGEVFKRGIVRYLPRFKIDSAGHKQAYNYQILNVTRGGSTSSFHTKKDKNNLIIYVGEKKVMLPPGSHEYTITYTAENTISFYNNFDELYWNVNGFGWDFPIGEVSAVVTLPNGTEILQTACYTGGYSSTASDCKSVIRDNIALLKAENIGANENLTIAVGFSKGIINEPPPPTFLEKFGLSILAIFLILGLSFYYFFTWKKYGVDPPKPTVYPLFDVPEKLSPASLGMINKERYRENLITSSIVNLGVKGYLKIQEIEKKQYLGLFKSKIFKLTKLKPPDDSLPIEEQSLLNTLFNSNQLDTVKLDGEYDAKIETAVTEYKKVLTDKYDQLLNQGNNYKFLILPLIIIIPFIILSLIIGFNHSSINFNELLSTIFSFGPYILIIFLLVLFEKYLSSKWQVISVAYLVVIVSLYFSYSMAINTTNLNYYIFLIFIIWAVITFSVYQYLIKRPSEKKLALQSKIDGFKMYLKRAEEKQIQHFNPPETTPEIFEKYLAYAIALNADKVWGEKFQTYLDKSSIGQEYQSSWYVGNNFHTINFGHYLNTSISDSISSSSTPPSSSSSGSGGGGFSGGGGGGGGGGGW